MGYKLNASLDPQSGVEARCKSYRLNPSSRDLTLDLRKHSGIAATT